MIGFNQAAISVDAANLYEQELEKKLVRRHSLQEIAVRSFRNNPLLDDYNIVDQNKEGNKDLKLEGNVKNSNKPKKLTNAEIEKKFFESPLLKVFTDDEKRSILVQSKDSREDLKNQLQIKRAEVDSKRLAFFTEKIKNVSSSQLINEYGKNSSDLNDAFLALPMAIKILDAAEGIGMDRNLAENLLLSTAIQNSQNIKQNKENKQLELAKIKAENEKLQSGITSYKISNIKAIAPAITDSIGGVLNNNVTYDVKSNTYTYGNYTGNNEIELLNAVIENTDFYESDVETVNILKNAIRHEITKIHDIKISVNGAEGTKTEESILDSILKRVRTKAFEQSYKEEILKNSKTTFNNNITASPFDNFRYKQNLTTVNVFDKMEGKSIDSVVKFNDFLNSITPEQRLTYKNLVLSTCNDEVCKKEINTAFTTINPYNKDISTNNELFKIQGWKKKIILGSVAGIYTSTGSSLLTRRSYGTPNTIINTYDGMSLESADKIYTLTSEEGTGQQALSSFNVYDSNAESFKLLEITFNSLNSDAPLTSGHNLRLLDNITRNNTLKSEEGTKVNYKNNDVKTLFSMKSRELKKAIDMYTDSNEFKVLGKDTVDFINHLRTEEGDLPLPLDFIFNAINYSNKQNAKTGVNKKIISKYSSNLSLDKKSSTTLQSSFDEAKKGIENKPLTKFKAAPDYTINLINKTLETDELSAHHRTFLENKLEEVKVKKRTTSMALITKTMRQDIKNGLATQVLDLDEKEANKLSYDAVLMRVGEYYKDKGDDNAEQMLKNVASITKELEHVTSGNTKTSIEKSVASILKIVEDKIDKDEYNVVNTVVNKAVGSWTENANLLYAEFSELTDTNFDTLVGSLGGKNFQREHAIPRSATRFLGSYNKDIQETIVRHILNNRNTFISKFGADFIPKIRDRYKVTNNGVEIIKGSEDIKFDEDGMGILLTIMQESLDDKEGYNLTNIDKSKIEYVRDTLKKRNELISDGSFMYPMPSLLNTNKGSFVNIRFNEGECESGDKECFTIEKMYKDNENPEMLRGQAGIDNKVMLAFNVFYYSQVYLSKGKHGMGNLLSHETRRSIRDSMNSAFKFLQNFANQSEKKVSKTVAKFLNFQRMRLTERYSDVFK
jgi:hypothetical protein